jgi:hypothetical protein
MLTVVFLLFIAVFLISGVFISLETRRRKSGQSGMKPVSLAGNRPRVGRATPDDQ